MSDNEVIMEIGQGSDVARSKDNSDYSEVSLNDITTILSLGPTLSKSHELGRIGEEFNASLRGTDKPLYMQSLKHAFEENPSLSTLFIDGNSQKDISIEAKQELVAELNAHSFNDIVAEQRIMSSAIANPVVDFEKEAENDSPSNNGMN